MHLPSLLIFEDSRGVSTECTTVEASGAQFHAVGGHSACVWNKTIVAFGGMDATNEYVSSDTFVFDTGILNNCISDLFKLQFLSMCLA